MSSDEDFRRVAEDMRALAKSLGRDVRQAAWQTRQRGDWNGRQMRDDLRDIADQARRNLRAGWQDQHRWQDQRGGTFGEPAGAPFPGAPPAGDWRPWPPAGHQPRRDGGHHRGWDRPPARPTVTPVARSRRHPCRRRAQLPPVRHHRDGPILVALLLVAVGTAGILVVTGAMGLSVEAMAAVALIVLGAVLVLTARTDWSLSRRAWPVWVGLGLLAILAVTSRSFGVPQADRYLSVGATAYVADPVHPLPGLVHGGFGTVTVDLTKASLGQLAADRTLTVTNVAGDIDITLPASQTVTVDARVTGGAICVGDQPARKGPGQRIHATVGGTARPVLRLTARDGFGTIRVDHPGTCG